MQVFHNPLRKALQVFLMIMLPFCLTGQVQVSRIAQPTDVQGKKGVVYSLPRTVIAVDVTVKATYKYRGPFADQAESMLGITDYVRQSGEEYEIMGVKVRSFTEPDPDQFFLVQMDEKADKNLELELGPDGGLMHAKTFSREVISGGRETEPGKVFPYYKPSAVKEETDTIRRIISVDTVTIQKYLLRNTLVMQSEDEKAHEAADMINVLKQDKYNILIGYQETAYEKAAMKYMVDRLESMEMEYLKLFTGITESEIFTISFFYTPETGQPDVLFYFSEDEGVAERGSDEVRVVLENSGLTKPLPDQSAADGKTGIFYRVPGIADVSIEYNGISLAEKRMIINQLGRILYLPTTATKVSLDPVTGNLRQATLQP